MSFFDALVLGLVEGITEFLPISSTGHLILTNKVLGIVETTFTTSFAVIIQLGAILAVVALYWKKIVSSKRLFKVITVAFIPTGIIGYLLYSVIKNVLLGNVLVVLISLFIGGLILILFEKWYSKKEEPVDTVDTITYKQAFTIGVIQSLAVIPGVSRSAATIVGGLSLGLSRKTIVEFSFLLAIPTMLAASVFDIYKNPEVLSGGNTGVLLVGFLTAFVAAFYAVKFLISYVQKNTFTSFGVYRIILAIVFFLFLIKSI